MKHIRILMLILFTMVVSAQWGQAQKTFHYKVVDLGTLGGSYSYLIGNGLSNGVWVTGDSTLPNDTADNAFLWHQGTMSPLGTLGGPNSFGWGTNDWGDAVGGAETSSTDPLQQQFCFADSFACLPFFWQNQLQTMIALPTLGGINGASSAINDDGVIVGQAQNSKIDATCLPSKVQQIRAALWKNGKVQELPLIKGDKLGSAFGINDWGQAVGTSGQGVCGSSSHAVLWQNGKVTDLGNFGGTPNEAYGINDLGQVVGYSTLSDGVTEHAFLWQADVMTDLGTLPGDVGSHAAGINFEGQVVGWSFDANGNERAFLWQNGVMTDLNTLIPADSYLYLLFADGINVWGQIAGTAYDINTGEEHAYLAIPSSYKGMNEPATERPKVTLPENVRQQLKRHMHLGRLQGGMVTSR